MKKPITVLLISCMCFVLASCSAATLTGDLETFSNADKSFSIDLPAEDKESWIIDEETSGEILDMTEASETVNVVVQSISKAKLARVATDLESYKTYVTENTFSEFVGDAKLKETSVEVPEFVTDTQAYIYSNKKSEGIIVCMESTNCYYTYLIMAAEGGYNANKKVIEESILSLKEISE